MRIFKTFLVLLAVLGTVGPLFAKTPEQIVQDIEQIDWMVEQYPPFNFRDKKDGRLRGITVDILMMMFEKVGARTSRKDLRLLPWPRAYRRLEDRPGTALFSTTYTAERLRKFKFVGPVIPTRVSLIAPKVRSLTVRSVADMDELRIGAIRDDVGEQLVRSLGVNDRAIHINNSAPNLIQMLARERIDCIAYAEDIARYHFKLAGLDPDAFESIYILKKSHMGYAFHKSTSPMILEPLRVALDELRTDGSIDSIYSAYLGHETIEVPGTN